MSEKLTPKMREACKINMLCLGCGNARRVERIPYIDPPRAIRCETAHCTICETGGVDMPAFYDRAGNELNADPWEFTDAGRRALEDR